MSYSKKIQLPDYQFVGNHAKMYQTGGGHQDAKNIIRNTTPYVNTFHNFHCVSPWTKGLLSRHLKKN